ncbi:metallophosphoesterase [Bacillus sp. BRMEA1]|uniref:metallophosphoesterase n=1 Tax=Neobacillus endophyticus TaxID=2738405 RepID=UPI001565B3EB|nr:metallophosphoesterase [Neobacillus endophyticus]NRD78703.1 metallophosphoesterase [Neobacillus endophyticus]
MPKTIKRRTFLKQALGSFLTILGLGSAGLFYANKIEPVLLETSEREIRHPLIPKAFDGVKIIQFSDTHLGFHYNLNQFGNLINKINSLKPDLIFFTGDLMDEPNKYPKINQIVPHLQRLRAPLGKYCIYGNHDHGGYGTEIYRNIMETADFTILLNRSIPISYKGANRIYLAGIDDAMLGKPDIPVSLKKVPQNHFTILLSHAPDLAEEAAKYPIHWQLSGHSHGGQVKIPFFGALVIPPFARIYQEGHYLIGENPLNLYVNRGIGTTRLPFRFMVKPELTVFTLKTGT